MFLHRFVSPILPQELSLTNSNKVSSHHCLYFTPSWAVDCILHLLELKMAFFVIFSFLFDVSQLLDNKVELSWFYIFKINSEITFSKWFVMLPLKDKRLKCYIDWFSLIIFQSMERTFLSFVTKKFHWQRVISTNGVNVYCARESHWCGSHWSRMDLNKN